MNTSRALLVLFFLMASFAAFSGCVEADLPEDGQPQAVTFTLEPSIVVHGADRLDIRLDRVFLGIGSIIFEPVDDPNAPAISTREMLALDFAMDGDNTAILKLPPISLEASGRYLVSIAIEPLPEETDDKPEQSVLVAGTLFHASSPHDPTIPGGSPKEEPEPLPWHVDDKNAEGVHDSATELYIGRIKQIPFEYTSDRTGFIRLGEVKLSPDHNDLVIDVNLDFWLDKALAPVFAELRRHEQQGSVEQYLQEHALNGLEVDLSPYIENIGLDLEHVFTTASAQAN